MKKVVKFMLITIFIILLLLSTVSYGFNVQELTGTDHQVDALKNAGNSVVKVISTVGIVISVVMLIILGIKYMMGSIEERADYKKSLVPYMIGAGLVFAASTIAQIIYDVANNL